MGGSAGALFSQRKCIGCSWSRKSRRFQEAHICCNGDGNLNGRIANGSLGNAFFRCPWFSLASSLCGCRGGLYCKKPRRLKNAVEGEPQIVSILLILPIRREWESFAFFHNSCLLLESNLYTHDIHERLKKGGLMTYRYLYFEAWWWGRPWKNRLTSLLPDDFSLLGSATPATSSAIICRIYRKVERRTKSEYTNYVGRSQHFLPVTLHPWIRMLDGNRVESCIRMNPSVWFLFSRLLCCLPE